MVFSGRLKGIRTMLLKEIDELQQMYNLLKINPISLSLVGQIKWFRGRSLPKIAPEQPCAEANDFLDLEHVWKGQ